MTDAPDRPIATPTEGITAVGAESAPFIYFDGAVTFGVNNGAIQIELAANVISPTASGGVKTEVVMIAHLRCSPNAAVGLRYAIDKALEMAAGTAPKAAEAHTLN